LIRRLDGANQLGDAGRRAAVTRASRAVKYSCHSYVTRLPHAAPGFAVSRSVKSRAVTGHLDVVAV
jgi:hypothetical protein